MRKRRLTDWGYIGICGLCIARVVHGVHGRAFHAWRLTGPPDCWGRRPGRREGRGSEDKYLLGLVVDVPQPGARGGAGRGYLSRENGREDGMGGRGGNYCLSAFPPFLRCFPSVCLGDNKKHRGCQMESGIPLGGRRQDRRQDRRCQLRPTGRRGQGTSLHVPTTLWRGAAGEAAA